MTAKVFELDVYDRAWYLRPKVTNYRNNDRLAIVLTVDHVEPADEDCIPGETFAILTVNLPDAHCPEGHAYLDTNNCPWAVSFVEENGLGEFTGEHAVSGFCTYPLFKIDTSMFNGDEDE